MARKPPGYWSKEGNPGYEIVKAFVLGEVDREDAITKLIKAGANKTLGKTDRESIGRHLLDWYAREMRKRLGVPGYHGETTSGEVRSAPSPARPRAERTTVGQGGRIVIPAAYRETLGLQEGDEVTLWLGENEVQVIPSDRVLEHVQALVRRYVPEGRSLADELIAERRREALRE